MNLLLLLAIIFIIVFIYYWRKPYVMGKIEKFGTGTISVPLSDHQTSVQIQDGTNGSTVLLLHNSPMDSGMWQPLYDTFAQYASLGQKIPTLISYDLRGHGTAWMPVDPKFSDTNVKNTAWTIDQFVDDCKLVYDKAIGTGKVIVCGFGFGGIVGQKFALKYPQLIEELVLLQTTIRPSSHLASRINVLGAPNGWIAQNSGITYLTNDDTFMQTTMCEWFYLPAEICGEQASSLNGQTDLNSPYFRMAVALLREGSATTMLQIDKLLAGTDFTADWKTASSPPFTIHILAASEDPISTPAEMTATYTDIYNTNRSMTVAMDIVTGKHGFTIMRPDYIAHILCTNCKKSV